MMYLVRRLLQMVLILQGMSVALFALLTAMPGDPTELLVVSNPNTTSGDLERLRRRRDLDAPWFRRYWKWYWGYHEARLPPRVIDSPLMSYVVDEAGQPTVVADLAGLLGDYAGGQRRQLEAFLRADWSGPELMWVRPCINELDANFRVGCLRHLQQVHPDKAEKLKAALAESTLAEFTLEGLFGAQVEGTRLWSPLHMLQGNRLWFLARDAHGGLVLGQVNVQVNVQGRLPAGAQIDEAKTNPLLWPSRGEPSAVVSQLYDSTVVEVSSSAKAAPAHPWIRDIPNQTASHGFPFQLELRSYLRVSPPGGRFALVGGSPGQLTEDGMFQLGDTGAHEEVIRFTVSGEDGQVENAAFVVELHPRTDDERFVPGVLHVLRGEPLSLGYSRHYQKTVWSLLFGEEVNQSQVKGITLVGEPRPRTMPNQVGGRIRNTLQLMIPALVLAWCCAAVFGAVAAYGKDGLWDRALSLLSSWAISMPTFWLGILLMVVFAERLQVLPAGGMFTLRDGAPGARGVMDQALHLVMPVCVLVIAYAARWYRFVRAAILETLTMDFVRTARAKGMRETRILLHHVLRHSLPPLVTWIGLSLPSVFGGALIVETVFAWPGVGRLQYEALMNHDFHVAMVVFLVSTALVMLGNWVSDALRYALDPRLRYRESVGRE